MYDGNQNIQLLNFIYLVTKYSIQILNVTEGQRDDDQFTTAKTGILDMENHGLPGIARYSDCLKGL